MNGCSRSKSFLWLCLLVCQAFIATQAAAQPQQVTLLSATAHQQTLTAGGVQKLRATVRSTTALQNAFAQIRVYDSARIQVAIKYFDSLNLTAGVDTTLEFLWFSPSTQAPGNYTVEVGVWASSWATLLYVGGLAPFSIVAPPAVALVSATVSRASIPQGQTQVVNATLQSPTHLSNLIVDIRIYNAAGERVARKEFGSVALSAGVPGTLRFDYLVPSDVAVGSYTVHVGVWDTTWATLLYRSGLAPFSITSFVWDDFANGFSVDAPGARWSRFAYGTFVANDGAETTRTGEGLRVSARGMSSTGLPAFTLSLSQDSTTGVPGEFDHVKWLVYMNHQASSGYPGFDALSNQELRCETWISGRTYGTERHPFSNAGISSDDLRLAAFAQNTIDYETGMVFDFFITNTTVYAIYERLPFARTAANRYAAFTYALPVAQRASLTEQHHVQIAYDRSQGVVRWILNGVEVFRVSQLGRRLPDPRYMILDHGGVEQQVSMRQLNCGMGMFTLLDGAPYNHPGLVRLNSDPSFYFWTGHGDLTPVWFRDEKGLPENRLFGQGAELRVQRYNVSGTHL